MTEYAGTTCIITGGAGFIGSNLVHAWLKEHPDGRAVVIDALTYAGHKSNLLGLDDARLVFVEGDITNRSLVDNVFAQYRPRFVFNLAAETHVDRSIDGPRAFVQSNTVGAFEMLDAALHYIRSSSADVQKTFRFVHVSTDEVYGSLGASGKFTEQSPYAPNSPYAASKASADFLARAYYHTFGLGVMTTNCSNNYGPRQFPEKLIPLMILNAVEGKSLPVYGDGQNVRDWLHVLDHCMALMRVAETGVPGETYNIGSHNERTNLELVHIVCDVLDRLIPPSTNPALMQAAKQMTSYRSLIQYVTDRPGHDRRYAIDASKIKANLGWSPQMSFEEGMEATVAWYLSNRDWCARVTQDKYQRQRLGLL